MSLQKTKFAIFFIAEFSVSSKFETKFNFEENYLSKNEPENDLMTDWINQRKFARGIMAMSVYDMRRRNNELSKVYNII